MRLGEKGIDILTQLLKWLAESRSRHIESELKKEQLESVREKGETRRAKAAVAEANGVISAKTLLKSGEPLSYGVVNLNDEQQKDFARYAKNYALTYALIKNEGADGKLLVCMEKDLQKVRDITDRMTEDAKIAAIDIQIEKLKEKGEENFTAQDWKELAALEDMRNGEIAATAVTLNNESKENIFKKIIEGTEQEAVTFERALNHITDRDYARNNAYYLTERTDPTKYIELKSQKDTYKGKAYTRTDYRVYDGTEAKGDFTDARFDGRPRDYWVKTRERMKEIGGFTDDVVLFNSQKEFEDYAKYYGENVKNDAMIAAETDHAALRDELTAALGFNGAMLNGDGMAIDNATGEPLKSAMQEKMLEEYCAANDLDIAKEKLRLMECVVIADQIAINEKLINIENEEARIAYKLRTAIEGSDEHKDLSEKRESLKNEKTNGLELAEQKSKERLQLSGIEATERVQKENGKEVKSPHREDFSEKDKGNVLDLNEWRSNIAGRRENISARSKTGKTENKEKHKTLQKEDR
jgi:hypothetical protein